MRFVRLEGKPGGCLVAADMVGLRQIVMFEQPVLKTLISMAQRNTLFFLAAAFLFSTTTLAIAAEIHVLGFNAKRIPVIEIVGPIVQDDADRFVAITSSYRGATIIFDSPGGNLEAALRIGRVINRRNFHTALLDGSRCFSACALMWLSGTTKQASPTSSIGFHAAYRNVAGEKIEVAVGNALIGSHLARLGLSDEAVLFVTSAGPDELNFLDFEIAEILDFQIASESISDFVERYSEGEEEPAWKKGLDDILSCRAEWCASTRQGAR